MPSSVSGQDNQILRCDWLSCPLGTARRVLQEKFPRKSENFSDFCKVLSQFAFRNMIVPLPKSQTHAYLQYSNYSYSGLIPNERALN